MNELAQEAHRQRVAPADVACKLLRVDDLDGAASIVEVELERIGDQGMTPSLWQLRFIRADILRLRGKPEEALRYLESQASANPPEKADLGSRAGLTMHRGYHLGLMAQFRAAHGLMADAERMSLQDGLIELQAEILLRQAMVFFLQRNYDTSGSKYREVLKLSGEIGGWYFRASALWGISKNLMIQRHYEEAMPWLDQSLKIFEDAGARLSIATVRGEMGVCQLGLGNDSDALELFEGAARIDFESGAIHNYQVALANIGNVYLHRRDYFAALSYYEKARDIAREIKDPVSVKKWTYNIRLTYARIRSTIDEQFPKPA